jgi:hypothetical protein
MMCGGIRGLELKKTQISPPKEETDVFSQEIQASFKLALQDAILAEKIPIKPKEFRNKWCERPLPVKSSSEVFIGFLIPIHHTHHSSSLQPSRVPAGSKP